MEKRESFEILLRYNVRDLIQLLMVAINLTQFFCFVTPDDGHAGRNV